MNRPEAKNDWNTQFPGDLSEVVRVVDELGAKGLDVHTVEIELRNGYWGVDFKFTDEDMQDGIERAVMNSHGGFSMMADV